MSWKRIKSFLIILFLAINILLVFSSNSVLFTSKTRFDNEVIEGTIDILNRNYGILVSEAIIPPYIDTLDSVDVTNIIYTEEFENFTGLKAKQASFEGEFITDIFSYNEENALTEMKSILGKLNISDESYKITVKKVDKGILCNVYEYINKYKLFNGHIKALFTPGNVSLSGTWYIVQNTDLNDNTKNNIRMADVTGVLLDLANISSADSALTPKEITDIKYGYHLSYYDLNALTKSAPAVPSYLIETDIGSKYYYDAISGLLIKQEE